MCLVNGGEYASAYGALWAQFLRSWWEGGLFQEFLVELDCLFHCEMHLSLDKPLAKSHDSFCIVAKYPSANDATSLHRHLVSLPFLGAMKSSIFTSMTICNL